jgi:CRP-like cAMP-binding protein
VRPAPEELRSMPLFAELGPAELDQVASWFDVEERDNGATLAQQGAAGYAFYVLKDGTATVIQGDEEIRRLGPGDFFGELSIIGDGRRTATVKGDVARHRLEHVRNRIP